MMTKALGTLVALLTAAASFADPLKCDLSHYTTSAGLAASAGQDLLVVSWAGQGGAELRARYAIDGGQPVVRELAIRKSGGQWMARCPAPDHEDNRASLSITEGKEQPVVFSCMAGCESAVILDTTNHPTPSTVPIGRYRQLRGTPCVGRLDPYRLYLPVPGTPAQPTADEILTAVRDDLTGHGAAGLDAFARFMDWYAGSAEVISVTRAAAERFAAAGLFELLAERGCAPAAEAAAGLRELSDAWYTVHLLTVHPRAGDSRHRQRVLRLMRQLADAERRFLDRLPG